MGAGSLQIEHKKPLADSVKRCEEIAHLTGRCMARELEKRGIRLDLVETWKRNAEDMNAD